MVGPPGDVALLSDNDITALCMALQEARKERSHMTASFAFTLGVTENGALTVHRGQDCTEYNVRELCRALLDDALEIVDLTERTGR